MEEKLREYAHLIVSVGLNLQKGQTLILSSPVECAPFARLCASAAYDLGAGEVVLNWTDDYITRERFLRAQDAAFETPRPWRRAFFTDYANEGAAYLRIDAEDPETLLGVSPARLVAAQRTSSAERETFDRLQMANGFPWCVAGAPIAAWARKVFPDRSEGDAVAALWAPTGGIVCPFNLTIALAENAFDNGVEFQFNTEVTGFTWEDGFWTIHTNHGDFESRYVINAAGVYADVLHNMVSTRKLHITPRRGDYCLLDKSTGGFVSHTIFQLPGKLGKGVLVSPTVHGNTIVGPTAIDIEDREGTNTTAEGLNDLIEKAGATVENLPIRQTITSFAGLRAHEDHHEFVIGEAEGAQQFIDCAGIESPGLTSSPAIGLHVSELMRDLMGLREKAHFIATRRGVLDPKTLSKEDYQQLIREKPAYGQIICRCEQVTEGEILDAIRRPLGAKSLDGVKRRTRAGMGRCQAGFCSPRTMEILARELGISQLEITKNGGSSNMVVGLSKDRT